MLAVVGLAFKQDHYMKKRLDIPIELMVYWQQVKSFLGYNTNSKERKQTMQKIKSGLFKTSRVLILGSIIVLGAYALLRIAENIPQGTELLATVGATMILFCAVKFISNK